MMTMHQTLWHWHVCACYSVCVCVHVVYMWYITCMPQMVFRLAPFTCTIT